LEKSINSSWLNYHHLYYFHAIARDGGMAKAAKRLGVGQPALSTQLKQLEERLGFALFERKSRSLLLTEKGRIVYEYATEIFRLGQEMIEAANDRLVTEQVHLAIGAVDSLPKLVLHELVESAYRLADCYVSMLEGDGERLFRELNAHRVDLVLSNSPAPLRGDNRLVSRRVAEIPVVICGAPPFAKLKRGFPRSLEDQPFILPTRHSKLRQDVDHYFEAREIRIRSAGETQDSEAQKLLAVSGRALIPIAEAAVKAQLRDGSLVRIGALEHVSEQIWLTTAARRVRNELASKLMKSFQYK
jgi:LysR family transcriptional activator of nhaA